MAVEERQFGIAEGLPSLSSSKETLGGNNEVVADAHDVFWEGEKDPKNPMNWPASKRWSNIVVISLISIVTYVYPEPSGTLSLSLFRPLASSMFAPAVPQVMADFGSNNQELASFVVSVYVIGFTLGPLVVAPLSEVYGRLAVYHISNVLFFIFTVACAVSTNVGMFTAFRFLSGCAGVTPITLGGGSIADVIPEEKRGTAMVIAASGSLIGPVSPLACFARRRVVVCTNRSQIGNRTCGRRVSQSSCWLEMDVLGHCDYRELPLNWTMEILCTDSATAKGRYTDIVRFPSSPRNVWARVTRKKSSASAQRNRRHAVQIAPGSADSHKRVLQKRNLSPIKDALYVVHCVSPVSLCRHSLRVPISRLHDSDLRFRRGLWLFLGPLGSDLLGNRDWHVHWYVSHLKVVPG